jgi:Tfp pilus assembly protein PilP
LPPVTANNSVDVSNSTTTAKPNTVAVSRPVAAAPAPSYTLIGILDLGDRSTAMIDINGSVQSIGLGKAINNTGWILSRVSQQEIILKRGKETKTIFVGQKF